MPGHMTAELGDKPFQVVVTEGQFGDGAISLGDGMLGCS